MSKASEDGVAVELAESKTDRNFFMAALLLGFASVMAVLVISMSVQVAIGSVFGLACGCFLFNYYRQIRPTLITGGTLFVCPFKLIHPSIKGGILVLDDTTQLSCLDDTLLIFHQDKRWQVAGFESQQELEITKAVLLGRPIGVRKVAVRMAE